MHLSEAGVSIARYTELVKRIATLGRRASVAVDVLDVLRRSGRALPFFRLRLGKSSGPQLCLTAGIHGDEPGGVEAVLQFCERRAGADGSLGVTAFPCLNPTGYIAGTRRNDVGYDLNRTFGQDPAPIETELLRQALAGRRFEFALDVHEDVDGQGFYLYEHMRGPQTAIGPLVVRRVRAAGFPIQGGDDVEGRALHNGCVAPDVEATSPTVGFLSIYMFTFHSDHTMVTESSAKLPLPARAAMHLTALDTIVESLERPRAGQAAADG